MARANYGAIENDQRGYGGNTTSHNDFKQLSESISHNIFQIQKSGSNLQKSIKLLGSAKDNQGSRDNMQIIQISTNQIINQTSQELITFTMMCKNADNRLLFLQIERLKNEFEKSLKNYSAQQQEFAEKVKLLPISNKKRLLDGSEVESSENQALNVMDDQNEKLQMLRQMEFEREMIAEREQRINQIEVDLIDVNVIMKELSVMVTEQGEHLNSIENNIEKTYTNVENGLVQLQKAVSHQRTRRKWLCTLTGLGLIIALIIGLVLYFELRA